MKYGKKFIGILLAVALLAASLMGCSSSSVNDSDVVMTIGDEEVTLGVVDFYASFLAAYYESYYSSFFGEDMWNTEISDGLTYEESTKEGILETMQEIIVARQHAEELGVSLTDEEIAEIEATAEEFYNANDESVRNAVSGSLENAIEVLTLFEIDDKIRQEIIKAVDTEVSDEEAAQKKATYVYCLLSYTDDDGNSVDMTEDELAALELELEELIANVGETGDLYTYAEEAGYTVLETTFDEDTTSLSDELLTALLELEEGEFSGVIKTDSSYYIAQLTSEFDEEATESMKETIISERESELYSETLAAWLEEVEIVVNEKIWATVEFQSVQFTFYYEDTSTEESTGEVTEETTEEVTE